MYRKDESKRSKTTETTLTQVWTKKGDDGSTSPDSESQCEINTDLYEFSKKVRKQCRKNNRESRESSERRLALSPSSIPPSTVLCGSTAVAASDDANESDETMNSSKNECDDLHPNLPLPTTFILLQSNQAEVQHVMPVRGKI